MTGSASPPPILPFDSDAGPTRVEPPEPSPRLRRNRACVAVIALGAANFLIYTIVYAILGGDAHNGETRILRDDAGPRFVYTVRGHFLREPLGREREVSAATWAYSYLHSISVLATSGAMVLSMLVLARPHIIATMRDGWISGRTFLLTFGGIVLLLTLGGIALFVHDFATGFFRTA
ncbi:MAG: hypothetical protein IPM64_04165 [Phycisphaerales bacterium]|nr:hypothetical protein [Phycisphaerales bacterium]